MAETRATRRLKTSVALLLAGLLAAGCMVSKEDYIKKSVRADELEDRNIALQQKLDDRALAEEELKRSLAEASEKLQEADRKGRGQQARINDLTAQLNSVSAEKSGLGAELDAAKKSLKAARDEGAAGKELLVRAKEEQTRSNEECAARIAKLDGLLERARTRIINLETERDVLTEARQKTSSEKEEKVREIAGTYEGLLAAVKQEAEKSCETELEGQHRDLVAYYEPRIEEIRGQALAYQNAYERLTVLVPFRISEGLLFKGTAATLTAEGKNLLNGVAKVLETEPERIVHIGVYGDRDPKAAANDKTPGPWEQTSARAASIARYLVEKGGVSPNRIIAAGYGDSNPVAGNDTKEGRAKNRRIEIKLLLPEMISE